MKLTKKQLKFLIKEASNNLLKEYEQSIHRDGDDLYLIDDDGNQDFFGTIGDHPEYEDLEDGGPGRPYHGGGSWSPDRSGGGDLNLGRSYDSDPDYGSRGRYREPSSRRFR